MDQQTKPDEHRIGREAPDGTLEDRGERRTRGRPRLEDGRPPAHLRQEPRQWAWWYDAIIDRMLANPTITKKELAEELGVSPQWVGAVTNSDMFKQKYDERRKRLGEALDQRIGDQLTQVASKSLELVYERLEQDSQKRIKFSDLKDLSDMSLNRLGYGPSAQGNGQVNVQVNVGGASREALQQAREGIRERPRLVNPEVADQSLGLVGDAEPADRAPASLSPGGERDGGLAQDVDDEYYMQELDEMLGFDKPGDKEPDQEDKG